MTKSYVRDTPDPRPVQCGFQSSTRKLDINADPHPTARFPKLRDQKQGGARQSGFSEGPRETLTLLKFENHWFEVCFSEKPAGRLGIRGGGELGRRGPERVSF